MGTRAQGLAATIAERLRAAGAPERAQQEKRYLKSELEHYGVTVPATRKIVLAVSREVELGRRELLALCRELWRQPVHELRAAAVELLEQRLELLEAGELELLEGMIRASRTWALSDNLSASVVGPLVERCPELGATLDRWALDPDFWIRRGSLLANLIPLREGRGDFARFARHAEPMLEEKEFFIRKAIGWVLRDTSKKRPELVHDWLLPRAARASGLTVREAVKHLDEKRRRAVLAAHQAPPTPRKSRAPRARGKQAGR